MAIFSLQPLHQLPPKIIAGSECQGPWQSSPKKVSDMTLNRKLQFKHRISPESSGAHCMQGEFITKACSFHTFLFK